LDRSTAEQDIFDAPLTFEKISKLGRRNSEAKLRNDSVDLLLQGSRNFLETTNGEEEKCFECSAAEKRGS
jgi:hypothetical protein